MPTPREVIQETERAIAEREAANAADRKRLQGLQAELGSAPRTKKSGIPVWLEDAQGAKTWNARAVADMAAEEYAEHRAALMDDIGRRGPGVVQRLDFTPPGAA